MTPAEVIRRVIREFLLRRRTRMAESEDRRIIAAHRDRLARQLEALVGEQAES